MNIVNGMRMKVVNKRFDKLSEWVTIVSKEVECGQKNEIYHSLIQKDYISALVLTNDNKIALVKQYRPAMEEFTYELPGGLLENSEDPADAMIRELYEETVILLNLTQED